MPTEPTAADAPRMASEALENIASILKVQFGLMDDVALGSAESSLSAIASLPPAPLPPEVAALVREARRIRRDVPSAECYSHDADLRNALAAIPLPGETA